MYFEPRGKTLFILLIPFVFGGLFQGVNDAIFSNNSMFNLFFGLYLGCLAGGLDVSWIPTLIPTSSYLNSFAGTLTTTTFLIGIFVCIFLAYEISQKYHVSFTRKEKLVFFLLSVFLYSAIWDMIFMIILFNIWTPELLGTTVDWLPPLNLGIIEFKVGFSWEFGVWFIFSRLALSSYFVYYLAVPKMERRQVEYY